MYLGKILGEIAIKNNKSKFIYLYFIYLYILYLCIFLLCLYWNIYIYIYVITFIDKKLLKRENIRN